MNPHSKLAIDTAKLLRAIQETSNQSEIVVKCGFMLDKLHDHPITEPIFDEIFGKEH